MHNVQFEITKPTDETAFEDMCARIYGIVFDDPLPQINGRRGQAQNGVDLFVDAPDGRIGIQCKKYVDGALKFKHIEHEVSRADGANVPIVRLIISTTATRDARLVQQVHDLSDQRVALGKHPVNIEFWQDLCRHITCNSKLQNDYAPNAPGAVFHRIEDHHSAFRASLLNIDSKLTALTGLPGASTGSVNQHITSQLDVVNDVLRAARFKDAQEALTRIGADMTLLDAHQQARWYVQRGICAMHLDSNLAAASDFSRAAQLYPDDEKIAAAKVRGLLLLESVEEALIAGQEASIRFPASVHVWVAYANAKMLKGLAIAPEDAPVAIRDNCDVLQLLAWSRKEAGDLAAAVELSAKALSKADGAFFVRSTALALALEAAVSDPVEIAYGLVSENAIAALAHAVEALTPRNDRLWMVQSPKAIEDTLAHLGCSYLVLGVPGETLALVEEAQQAGMLSPRLKRAALDAYRRLNRPDELIQFGRAWLDDLEEEALILVAEQASVSGDVALVEAVQVRVVQKDGPQEEVLPLLRALKWGALWNSGLGQKQALEDVRSADIPSLTSLALICGGARILHAARDDVNSETAIAKACSLVSESATTTDRLLLADLLFATDKLELAAIQYELLAPRGMHSELHNRLLHCYVRSGALRKAKELIISFPEAWPNDERALGLAIDLGQQVSDWAFLVPLAELHCRLHPHEAGGWLLRLALDLKMRKMASFHQVLRSLPEQLSGSPRLLQQVVYLELRFGYQESGMWRLYRLFRQNLADVNAALSYVTTIVAGPADLPFMEDALMEVRPGSAVTLKSAMGEIVTLALDPEGTIELPPCEEFISLTGETARGLLGAVVGQSVTLPGRFGTELCFAVVGVTSVYRWLLQRAQKQVSSPTHPDLPFMNVPVPTTEDGADFSHVHAMLKRYSEQSRQALWVYENSPITLGVLGKLLGKKVVDMVANWPNDAPPLNVCDGTREQQEFASKQLHKADAEYVVDAATMVELAFLECLDALAALPRVYISTKSVEMLEASLEEAKLERSGGHLFDDNGTMRFTERTALDRELQVKFVQSIVDAVGQHCLILPAYGPEEMPLALRRMQNLLADEELAALLLTAEKCATLLTVDERLAQAGAAVAGLSSICPQEVLRYAATVDKLGPHQCSLAVIRMFLRNRSFVHLCANDIVFMCLQGGRILVEGLQQFKKYLSSGTSELESAMAVAFQFLELQGRYPTQWSAFSELFGHIVEALLLHPNRNRAMVVEVARQFALKIALCNGGDFVPFELDAFQRQRRIRFYANQLYDTIDSAVEFASKPRQRAIKLRVLMCTQPPHLVFDDIAGEQTGASSRGEESVCSVASNLGEGETTTVVDNQVYLIASESDSPLLLPIPPGC